jgi:osmotically inducible protein OsmC
MTTYGSAVWKGGLKDGIGAISTKSGALKDHPYGFVARFEGGPGTNPEELIGAAHSGCFTMALSKILGDAGFTATEMNTKAEITLAQDGDGFTITKSHLTFGRKFPASTRPSSRSLRAWPKRAAPSPRC